MLRAEGLFQLGRQSECAAPQHPGPTRPRIVGETGIPVPVFQRQPPSLRVHGGQQYAPDAYSLEDELRSELKASVNLAADRNALHRNTRDPPVRALWEELASLSLSSGVNLLPSMYTQRTSTLPLPYLLVTPMHKLR